MEPQRSLFPELLAIQVGNYQSPQEQDRQSKQETSPDHSGS
jgi:hypothetical protein